MNAIQQSAEKIKQNLGSGVWQQGARLPALDQLAAICGVSRKTMWKATALLAKQSLIHITAGKAIIAGAQQISALADTAPAFLWERLAVRIRRDLVSGSFSGHTLPPVTKLALKYGVTVRTLRKALGKLTADGLLAEQGLKFLIPQSKSIQHQPAVVFISAADITGGISTDEYRTLMLVDTFERECPRMRLVPQAIGFNPGNANSLIDIRAVFKKMPLYIGSIVNIWYPWDAVMWQRWIDLLSFLAAANKPVIVIDQGSDCQFPDALLRYPQFRVLRIAGERAGETVADYLYRNGHRKVAYITTDFKTQWAQDRHAGLSRFYNRHGEVGTSVEFFEYGENVIQAHVLIAALDMNEEMVRALYHQRFSNDQIKSLLPVAQSRRSSPLFGLLRKDPMGATAGAMLRTLQKQLQGAYDPRMISLMQAAILHGAGDRAFELALRPFLDRAAQATAASAWVCSDDKLALAAIGILKGHGKKVPVDISVIGFNNWRDAHEHHLSTYDFNMDRMIRDSLLMIADEKSLKERKKFSEVDGYVVERRTTRK